MQESRALMKTVDYATVTLLATWKLKKQRLPEKDGVILHRITRTDPKTGLAMICEISATIGMR